MVQGRSPNNPLQRSDHDKVHAPDCCADGGFSGYAKLVFRAFIAAGVLVASQPGWAQVADSTPMQPEALEELAEVLVTGEHPGPGLWRIAKQVEDREHVLWIVGASTPLPKGMTWNAKQVERVMSESRRLVTWVRVDVDFDVGFFSTLGALPSVFGADRNVDDAHLRDVVSADAYAKWLELKAKYLPKDTSAERLRPTFAWTRLSSAAYAHSGLTWEPVVESAIKRLAKKHKLKVVKPPEAKLRVEVKKPRALLKKFKTTPLADADCFAKSLSVLESNIEGLRARANAWAIGDVATLRERKLDFTQDCTVLWEQAIMSGELPEKLGVGESFNAVQLASQQAAKEALDHWLATIDKELNEGRSTLAVVPIGNLFGANGLLERFRQKGYSVTEPSSE
jgi:hypothetical protein